MTDLTTASYSPLVSHCPHHLLSQHGQNQRDQRGVANADCRNRCKWGLLEYKWKWSFLGWFVGLVVPVCTIDFLSCLGCSSQPSTKYYLPHRTLFHFISPYRGRILPFFLYSFFDHQYWNRFQEMRWETQLFPPGEVFTYIYIFIIKAPVAIRIYPLPSSSWKRKEKNYFTYSERPISKVYWGQMSYAEYLLTLSFQH